MSWPDEPVGLRRRIDLNGLLSRAKDESATRVTTAGALQYVEHRTL